MTAKYKKIIEDFKNYESDTGKTVDEFLAQLPAGLLRSVGCNTPCVEIKSGKDRIILDGGSGLRGLGLSMLPQEGLHDEDIFKALGGSPSLDSGAITDEKMELTIIFSHTHWDHIQGVPFFYPAYLPNARLRLYHQNSQKLSKVLNFQQTAPQLFPVSLSQMGAEISFHDFPKKGLTIGKMDIQSLSMPHPGGSLAFRINSNGKSVVYATDYELYPENKRRIKLFQDFIKGADMLISDSHFTYLESITKQGWGHSTAFSAVSLAMEADVRDIYLFHHNHEHSDEKILESLEKAKEYYEMMESKRYMGIYLAMEGLSVEV